MQRYFAGELRGDQKESWKAEDGIFVLFSEAELYKDKCMERALSTRDILLKSLETKIEKQDEEIERLKAENAKLKSGYDLCMGDDYGDDPIECVVALKVKLAKLTDLNNKLCRDFAKTDVAIRELLRPHLDDVDGDSDGVPALETLVEGMVAKVDRLKKEINRKNALIEALRKGPLIDNPSYKLTHLTALINDNEVAERVAWSEFPTYRSVREDALREYRVMLKKEMKDEPI